MSEPTQALTTVPDPVSAEVIERVIVQGDLARLTPPQRNAYYLQLCQTLGLRAITRPFEYLTLNNKLVLYARKDATDQLRNNHGISVRIVARDDNKEDGTYTVTARAERSDGRYQEATGSVGTLKYIPGDKDATDPAKKAGSKAPMTGDDKANAIMKAETKAFRRATLAICGLGFLDENEVADIPASAKKEVIKATPAQVESLNTLIPTGKAQAALFAHYGIGSFKDLTTDDAAKIIRNYEAAKVSNL